MKLHAPTTDAPLIEWAEYWATHGWEVFPVCSPLMGDHTHSVRVKGQWVDVPCEKDIGKTPMVGGGLKAATNALDKIREWWTKWPTANVAGTPPKGWIVVDIDGETDLEFPATREHSTGKGRHLVYKDTPTGVGQHNRLWDNVDTRASGKGYIVLPPSLHKSGVRYAVVSDATPNPFPVDLLAFKRTSEKVQTTRKGGRSELAELLSRAQDDPSTGDDWMAQVAGHIAKLTKDESVYTALIERINLSLADPLDVAAMAKKRGIFEAEQSKLKNTVDLDAGGLFEYGEAHGLFVLIDVRGNMEPVRWSDFTVKTKALIEYDDKQVWIVDFTKNDGTVLEDVELPSAVLASTQALRRFFMDKGMTMSVDRRDNAQNPGERLLKYLRAQDGYLKHKVVNTFGWTPEKGGFVTPDSIITMYDIHTDHFKFAVPDVDVSFGFRDEQFAKDKLREFMSFTDPNCMAMIGSWLMTLFLKGQTDVLHPGLVLEGYAGSSKTQIGKVLCQLAGVDHKGGKLTHAVARDQFSLSQNTIVWIDDIELDDTMQQLLRIAGTQGEYQLKDMVNVGQVKTVKLLASPLLSAESVPFARQKANRDRFVILEMPTIKDGKESLARWNAFKASVAGDFRCVAGNLVQFALQRVALLDDLHSLIPDNSRIGQAMGLMRVGARILADLLDDASYVTLVDGWIDANYSERMSSLVTEQVIPTIWRENKQPMATAVNGFFAPVWRDPETGRFWVNAQLIADQWHKRPNVSQRERELTATPQAVRAELRAIGCVGDGKRFSTMVGGSQKQYRYVEIPDKYSDIILEASGH